MDVEAVIHLAAKVGLGVDVSDLPDYASSNDAGTAELLAGMARAGVARLTLASSMVVYGEGVGHCAEHGAVTPGPRAEAALAAGQFEPPCPHCGAPLGTALVSESAPLDPRNAYASSKVAQEFYAANWARDDRRLGRGDALSQRLRSRHAARHALCGRGGDLHLGAAARRGAEGVRGRRTAARFRACARCRRRHGAGVRDSMSSGVRAFNVGSGTPRTVGDMARALAKALNGPEPVVTGHYRLGDVRHITADSSRLRGELGWSAAGRFRRRDGRAGARRLTIPAGYRRRNQSIFRAYTRSRFN